MENKHFRFKVLYKAKTFTQYIKMDYMQYSFKFIMFVRSQPLSSLTPWPEYSICHNKVFNRTKIYVRVECFVL